MRVVVAFFGVSGADPNIGGRHDVRECGEILAAEHRRQLRDLSGEQFLGDILDDLRRRFIVVHRAVAVQVVQLIRRTIGIASGLGDTVDLFRDHQPVALIVRAHAAGQERCVGNDIQGVRRSRLENRIRDDTRMHRIHFPGNDRLDLRENLTADDDRVDARMRKSSMAAFPVNGQFVQIGIAGVRARLDVDHSQRHR